MAYLFNEPRIFGKRPNGQLGPIRAVVLVPFLAMTSVVWHCSRILSREPAVEQLTDEAWLGRRLIGAELPNTVSIVLDLTAEFHEPLVKIGSVRNYLSLPILDGSTLEPDKIRQALTTMDHLEGVIFIHCAQGHGRTALVAACWLLHSGRANSAEEAIGIVLRARPGARLAPCQKEAVEAIAARGDG